MTRLRFSPLAYLLIAVAALLTVLPYREALTPVHRHLEPAARIQPRHPDSVPVALPDLAPARRIARPAVHRIVARPVADRHRPVHVAARRPQHYLLDRAVRLPGRAVRRGAVADRRPGVSPPVDAAADPDFHGPAAGFLQQQPVAANAAVCPRRSACRSSAPPASACSSKATSSTSAPCSCRWRKPATDCAICFR